MTQPTTTTPVDPFDKVAAAAHRLHVNLDDTGTVSEFLRQLAASSPQLAAALHRAKQRQHTCPPVHQPDSAWTDDNGHGTACACGASYDGFPTHDEAAQALADHIDGFKPAAWQTQPCPTWCIGGHRDSDYVDDRFHYATEPARIPLTLHDPVGPCVDGSYGQAKAWVDVDQHVNAANPTIKVGIGDKAAFLNLTVDEADQLRAELAAVVSMLTSGLR